MGLHNAHVICWIEGQARAELSRFHLSEKTLERLDEVVSPLNPLELGQVAGGAGNAAIDF